MAYLDMHLDTLKQSDADAMAALYADDAQMLTFEAVADGRDAIRDQFQAFFDYHGALESVTITHRQEADGAAFALYAITSARGRFELVNAFDLDGDAARRHFSNVTTVHLNRQEVEREM